MTSYSTHTLPSKICSFFNEPSIGRNVAVGVVCASALPAAWSAWGSRGPMSATIKPTTQIPTDTTNATEEPTTHVSSTPTESTLEITFKGNASTNFRPQVHLVESSRKSSSTSLEQARAEREETVQAAHKLCDEFLTELPDNAMWDWEQLKPHIETQLKSRSPFADSHNKIQATLLGKIIRPQIATETSSASWARRGDVNRSVKAE